MTPPSGTDPTENVIAIVEAAVQRQDDLREAERRRVEAEERHVRELLRIQAEHAKQLREAESARLDAIRDVDVLAVSRATEAAQAMAKTLAEQTATLAETTRAQVAVTAQASVVALDAALLPIQKDISELRQFMFENAGVSRGEQQQTVERRAASASRVSGVGLLIAGAAAFSAFLLGVAGITITLLLR